MSYLMWCEALHLCSPSRVFFLYLSRCRYQRFVLSGTMISRKKIREDSFKSEIELITSVARSFLMGWVRLQKVRQKSKFLQTSFFSHPKTMVTVTETTQSDCETVGQPKYLTVYVRLNTAVILRLSNVRKTLSNWDFEIINQRDN